MDNFENALDTMIQAWLSKGIDMEDISITLQSRADELEGACKWHRVLKAIEVQPA